jgi:hypothetical protein
MHDTPAHDPRLVWQAQGTEHRFVSVQEVRLKAQIAGRKARRNLVVASVVALLLLALCSFALINFSGTPVRMIASAMMLLTVTGVCKAWYRMWPLHTLSPNAALVGCAEFYRKELLAQYRSAAITWRLVVPVVMFAFLMWNALFRTNPLVPKILLPSVLVLVFFVRRHNRRGLQRKLSVLDSLEKENSQ